MNEELFKIVGIHKRETPAVLRRKREKFPYISAAVLAVIVLGCIFAELIMTHDPSYMDLGNFAKAPGGEFIFGTDTMGRDIFSMIWYGGRLSLAIGLLSTAISTVIAFIYGTISGISGSAVDNAMMRLTDILLSIPTILTVIFLQAVLGAGNILTISVVIGVTSWMSVAKIVRSEVRQLRSSDFVHASKCMGGGFFHILVRHLMPNFLSAVMFMVVMNISSAIAAESTLSFLGIGLPADTVSWGSMMSLAQNAMLTKAWWIIVIPGIFLVLTLLSITNLGKYLREKSNKKQRNI